MWFIILGLSLLGYYGIGVFVTRRDHPVEWWVEQIKIAQQQGLTYEEAGSSVAAYTVLYSFKWPWHLYRKWKKST